MAGNGLKPRCRCCIIATMKLLLWDFDGTLGTRDGAWTNTLCAMVAAAGCDAPSDAIRQRLRSGFFWHDWQTPHCHVQTAEQWWAHLTPMLERAMLGAGVNDAIASRLAAEFRHEYLRPGPWWRLYDDTLATLAALSARGWRHRILSNHVPEFETIAERLGLTPHIDRIFNSAVTGYEKPHPRSFELAMEGVPPGSTIWMIGDNPQADIAGAESVGIPAILVRTEHPQAKYSCATLDRLADIIEA